MAPVCGVKIVLQVIDAKEDMQDCQRQHLSRKLAGTSDARVFVILSEA
jgi:hypothetical protein